MKSSCCCVVALVVFCLLSPVSLAAEKAEKAEKDDSFVGPNIVIVMGDDCTHSDLSLYGGQNVQTPRIDALAAEGMIFSNAFLAEAMCLPCRSELYTGLYPVRSGACYNHSAVRPGTQSICHFLSKRGYRVGLAGKKHVVPAGCFPFEDVPGLERGCCSKTARFDDTGLRKFMTRDTTQPFCLVVGLVVPHTPWTVGDPSRFKPRQLKLPPYMIDTPETRTEYAKYLAEIEVLDEHVGRTLDAIEAVDQTDNTLVLFSSEQGSAFPGCKWTAWEQGLHTAMVVRWPGEVASGSRTEALVQFADVLPTLIEVSGGDPASQGFDGSSFLDVLHGKKNEHRQYVYGIHNNIPEGPAYPIRSIRDTNYRYIRNLTPEVLYIEKHVVGWREHHGFWPSWMAATWNNPQAHRILHRYMLRPAEELYRTSDDRFELDNLADDQAHVEVKARLRTELDRWMTEQHDPGVALDTHKAYQASRHAK